MREIKETDLNQSIRIEMTLTKYNKNSPSSIGGR